MTPQEMIINIKWLGHDSFRIEGSKTIYIDPYQIGSGAPADLVLVTHEHFDHCSPDDVSKVQVPGTKVITEKDSATKLSGDVQILTPGEHITVEGVTIEALPAYNVDKSFHPKEKGWLGFIVEMDGVRIYHAGDTDYIPEMSGLKTDIALLPISGTYVMTAAEAVEAALAIQPQIAIPMHYGAIVGDTSDAETFKSALEGKIEVVVLEQT
ncbi:hypothetical protein D3OALGA1CA_4432 [Olavius algarvensis associated proteobacterium Delta 3]|nr:hypothetical protein D3OALGA1CA_4432 [Olavius algarvensis associated proteobacterium Delta 3]